MNEFFVLALMILTTYRTTWMITRDGFPPVRRAREWVEERYVQNDKLEWAADLVTCYWCVSVWAAAGVTFFTWLALDSMPLPLLWFGATAAGAAAAAALTDKLES